MDKSTSFKRRNRALYGHDLLLEEECPLAMIDAIGFVNYKKIIHIKVCQAVI